MRSTVSFSGRGKLKIKGLGYLQRTPDIEFQRYRSIGLGVMFSDCHRDRRTDKWTFFGCGSDVEAKIIIKKIEVKFSDDCKIG